MNPSDQKPPPRRWIPCVQVGSGPYSAGAYSGDPKAGETSAAAVAALGSFLGSMAKMLETPPPRPAWADDEAWASLPAAQNQTEEVLTTHIAGFHVRVWWKWA